MGAREMTVLAASPSCVGGGAERVAHSLHHAYLGRGVDSWLAVANRNCDEDRVLAIPPDEGRSAWARSLLPAARALARRRGAAGAVTSKALRLAAEPSRYARVLQGHEDFDIPATARLLDVPPTAPDVLHLHNLHGSWFDIRALPALSSRVPTMLTLHDAWLLTGHCAYPLDCARWKEGCGACPHLDVYVPIRRDASATNARVKRESVAASRLALACPSRWLLDMVEASGILSPAVSARVVHNGIDTSVFRPGDKAAARERLGLPQAARVVSSAARGLESSSFKGFETLRDALGRLDDLAGADDMLLLALGSESGETRLGGLPVRTVPFVEDPAVMALYYQASDVYVHPARAESFGLAVAEAMACGAAVIASNVGGIPEIVVDGESGLLFEPGDAAGLASLIRRMLDDTDLRAKLAAGGPERIGSRFTLARQVDAYLGWYLELVEGWTR